MENNYEGWISSTIVSKLLSEIDMPRETFDKIVSLTNAVGGAVEISKGKKGYSIKFKKDITIYIDN